MREQRRVNHEQAKTGPQKSWGHVNSSKQLLSKLKITDVTKDDAAVDDKLEPVPESPSNLSNIAAGPMEMLNRKLGRKHKEYSYTESISPSRTSGETAASAASKFQALALPGAATSREKVHAEAEETEQVDHTRVTPPPSAALPASPW